VNALRCELLKLAKLPSVWAATAVGLLFAPVLAFINSSATLGAIRSGTEREPLNIDWGYQGLSMGVVGAIILGVVAVSSEYAAEGEESAGTRQIITSLTAVPSRARFLIAKTGAVALLVACLAVATSATTLTVIAMMLGESSVPLTPDTAGRVAGVTVYWVLTALLACGITLLTRSGIVPLTVLILNASMVSVSYLLTRVTTLANYLPDRAGLAMFVRDFDSTVRVDPLTGGAVMACWVCAVLIAGAMVFRRRDV
jgi:ABC-type transport system involved in multi-copper enzyme maturation permease subunit